MFAISDICVKIKLLTTADFLFPLQEVCGLLGSEILSSQRPFAKENK